MLKQMLTENFPDENSSLCESWCMSVEQLKALDATGMWIGAHSMTHAGLGGLSESDQTAEIEPRREVRRER